MKTVSLELSKQLREQGYPQVSTFMWDGEGELRVGIGKIQMPHQKTAYPDELTIEVDKCFASPTADEVLGRLPKKIKGSRRGVMHWLQVEIMDEGYKTDDKNGWSCQYFNPNFGVIHFEEESILADAAAKMWLYLKKEGLL